MRKFNILLAVAFCVGCVNATRQGIPPFLIRPTPSDWVADVTAASCSDTDVAAAFTTATTGQKVAVPAGNCTWTSGVTVSDSETLDIRGAGAGVTVITLGASTPLTLGISDSSVGYFTFTSAAATDTFVTARGDGGTGRIHHNTFTNTTGGNRRCVYFSGGTGIPHAIYLIDHNTFNNCRVSIAGDLGSDFGEREWEASHAMGLFNHVFIEDNTFSYPDNTGNLAEADYGASMTVRFNTIARSPIEGHNVSGGTMAGTKGARVMEMYGNTFTEDGTYNYGMWWRSGSGIGFSNTFAAAEYSTPIIFDVSNRSTVANECDGTNAVDGNTGSGGTYPGAGYPCMFQPGFGTLAGEFVPGTFQTMTLTPIPLFLNRKDGAVVTPAFANGAAEHVSDCIEIQQEDQTFDGTCGTGVGVIASIPATCTTGVFYWATDEGEWNSTNGATADGRLYKCVATNDWDLFYTPYTYPHPLTE